MTRKISILFVLTVLILSFTSFVAFAATNDVKRGGGAGWQKDHAQAFSGGEAYVPSGTSKPAPAVQHTSLGFLMTANAYQIGDTHFDYQANGRINHQIGVGCGGRVYNIWMYTGVNAITPRTIQYESHLKTGAGFVPQSDISGEGPGYAALSIDPGNGTVCVGWHLVSANGTQVAKDAVCNGGSFSPVTFTQANSPFCTPVVTGSTEVGSYYIWPSIAADIDGASNPVIHAFGYESYTNAPAGAIASLVYYRTNGGVTGIGPTCGFFVDSVFDISQVVVANPNNFNVALVWTHPRGYATLTQHNNDIYYIESTNLGTNWGVRHNVSNYASTDVDRAYTECSALYTRDNCLHIIWNSNYFDSTAQTFQTQKSRLWHWDNCTSCKSLLLDANYARTNCDRGAWNLNVCKINLAQCTISSPDTVRLYATYTYFTSNDAVPASADCGLTDSRGNNNANGEIYMQVSDTKGTTWGAPINLTNTMSNNCAAGNCFSEHWSSSAPYVTDADSLRIQYILDKDAGGITQTEGSWTNNPVMNLTQPCIAMTPVVTLNASPGNLIYPYHTVPSGTNDTTITLLNTGNQAGSYTRSVTYTNGSGWISFPTHPSTTGNVPAGCTNSESFTLRSTGPASEGLYKASVDFTYTARDAQAVASIPVELYNFSSWFLPQVQVIRTTSNKLGVSQVSRASTGITGDIRGFQYFADTSNYLFDGSLVMGNSSTNLSWQIFQGGSGAGPTVTNPFGYLYALSNTSYPAIGGEDTAAGAPTYRHASGIGTNRDSTLGFKVDWYASKHPDSSDFYLGSFKLYKGVKNPTGSVTALTVAYACDWDIPDDSSENQAGFDAPSQMVYQKGAWAPNANRYGATAGLRNDNVAITGGFTWNNDVSVYPVNGYENDTLWNKLQATSGYTKTDSTEDMNAVIVLYKNATVNGATNDTLKFYVIFAGQYKTAGSVTGLQNSVARAKKFICTYLNPSGAFCIVCTCGDANSDHVINISDAVFLIQYIFGGGAAPNPLCNGDANGDHVVNISDAVFLIQYIFGGGPAPHGC